MKEKKLSQTQIENLIDLVAELQKKLKKKNEHLTLARQRVSRGKQTIERLQRVIDFQRERILKLHRGEDLSPQDHDSPIQKPAEHPNRAALGDNPAPSKIDVLGMS